MEASFPTPTRSGLIDFSIPSTNKPCRTWYSLFPPPNPTTPPQRPLVILHGGPGIPHQYLLPITQLASPSGIPVILYDQIGCGNSTHLPEKAGDASFWTEDLFLSELDNLLKHLEIQDDYDILGHSCGGMLGALHATQQPTGLHRLILSDTPASMSDWVIAADKLRAQLPKDVQEVLLNHEKDGTTDSEEYEAAIQVYYDKHVCRTKPTPAIFLKVFELLKRDDTVYKTMIGPSEFFITGSLKKWSIVIELHKINVPTLLINGKYDEAQDEVMEPFFREIEKVRWVRFAESSHLPRLEETEEYLKVVSNFLQVE